MADDAAQDQEPQDQPDQTQADDTSGDKDWQAEAEKWRNLARKHEKTAKDNRTAAEKLAEIEQQNQSESERFAEAQIRAVEAELQLQRYQVAMEKKLPASAAMFLYGDDEDAIGESADALIAFATEFAQTLGTQRPTVPDFKQGNRGGRPAADPNDAFRQAIRSRNIFG